MDTVYRLEYISTFHADIAQMAEDLEEYPQKAARILSKLDKILSHLALMPEMFPVYEDFPIFRKIVVEDYVVFYLLDRVNNVVEIHRLLYGAMNLPEWLSRKGTAQYNIKKR